MPRTYTTEALAAVHEMMEGLSEAGAIDKQTLREFDEACLGFAPQARQGILQPDRVSRVRCRSTAIAPTLLPAGGEQVRGANFCVLVLAGIGTPESASHDALRLRFSAHG